MGLFDRLLGRSTKAAPVRTPRDSTVAYLPGGDSGAGKRMRNFESYQGALCIGDVYKCVSTLAATVSATPLLLRDSAGTTLDMREALPALDALLARPNAETRGRAFIQALIYDYALTGNIIILLDSFTGTGAPTELWRLNPAKVRIRREGVGRLVYGVDRTEGGVARTDWYSGAEIIHVKAAPNPKDDLWGVGPVECGELTLSRARATQELVLSYLSRGALPDGVLTVSEDISEEDRRSILQSWREMREGARNRFRTALLWKSADYKPIQEPLGSMPVADLLKSSRNDIFELWGTPPQLAGDFSNTNYRNAQESVGFYYGETVLPVLRTLEEDLWAPLLESFTDDDGLTLVYEEREVVDQSLRADAAAKLAGTGAFDVNTIRQAGGYDPLPEDDPFGAQIAVPSGVTYQSPDEAPPALPALPSPAPESGGKAVPHKNGRVTVSAQPHPDAVARTRRAYEAWSAEFDESLWDETRGSA